MTSPPAALDDFPELAAWWRDPARQQPSIYGYQFISIAGSEYDQAPTQGHDNPYWDVIRHMPSMENPWDGATPYTYAQMDGLGVNREKLVTTYAWSIPSPGDVAWIGQILDGRPVVEVGAGSGYWAWQLAQAGHDVIAYEPNEPAGNTFVGVDEPYFPVLRHGAEAAGRHPDRALFLSWPSYGEPWAAQALACYQGDLIVYLGEECGGACADDQFFELLGREWTEVGRSPHHVTWWGINDRLIAYRRRRP